MNGEVQFSNYCKSPPMIIAPNNLSWFFKLKNVVCTENFALKMHENMRLFQKS